MRLAWLTDIHLNFVSRQVIEALTQEVQSARPDAVLLGGDIGEASDVVDYLELLSRLLRMPLYFVLGNHDFYGGSVSAVRTEVARCCRRTSNLIWLNGSGIVSLTPRTALIGHDGWGDGGFGNARGSPIMLNDFLLIEELRGLGRAARLEVLRQFGDEAGLHFRTVLPAALQSHQSVVVLTHVPPFREAAWHEGRTSDDNWLPFFACKAAGDALREAMTSHPERRLTVLCGHTHGAGACQVLPNLEAVTGGAVYGQPRLQRVIEID